MQPVRADSEVTRPERNAGCLVVVSPLLADALAAALDAAEETDVLPARPSSGGWR